MDSPEISVYGALHLKTVFSSEQIGKVVKTTRIREKLKSNSFNIC